MSDFYQQAENLSPDIYQRFKQAIALGKWPDGKEVSAKQRALMLEAIIVYEQKNLPPEEQTGHLDNQCASKRGEKSAVNESSDDVQPISLQ